MAMGPFQLIFLLLIPIAVITLLIISLVGQSSLKRRVEELERIVHGQNRPH